MRYIRCFYNVTLKNSLSVLVLQPGLLADGGGGDLVHPQSATKLSNAGISDFVDGMD